MQGDGTYAKLVRIQSDFAAGVTAAAE